MGKSRAAKMREMMAAGPSAVIMAGFVGHGAREGRGEEAERARVKVCRTIPFFH